MHQWKTIALLSLFVPSLASLFQAEMLAQESVCETAKLCPDGDVVVKYRQSALDKWETHIHALELLDQSEQHPDDAILFTGSSSIRRWETIAEDMAPYHPIRRGYGGAKYSDLAVFADRLIHPHDCRAIVIFVANDVAGFPADKTPQEVSMLVNYILQTIRAKMASTPVFFIEITPTELRFHAWEKTRLVNAAIREICLTTPNTYFIATAEHFLDANKQPVPSLFVEDRLHLNQAGYDLWSSLIKRTLDDVLEREVPSAINDGPTAATTAGDG